MMKRNVKAPLPIKIDIIAYINAC